MKSVITYSFCEPFLVNLADYLEENYIRRGRDLSRLALVFGGRRPTLFLKRELARRLKTAYVPPRFFTIDEFLHDVVSRNEDFSAPKDLDQCYWLFRLASETTPEILKGRETFARFLPWTKEILAFIDQLDIENVEAAAFGNIRNIADIGFDVPADINQLLKSVAKLRELYHSHMLKEKVYSRGFLYRRASHFIGQTTFGEYDEILFCNFFYLNRSEEAVMKNLQERGVAKFFFQGDERRWPVLKRAARCFNEAIVEGETVDDPRFDLKLYSAFDTHSEVGLIKEILKTIPDLASTVIVLPNADNVIPLLSEIASSVDNFNVSLGYPLRRSSLYALLELVFASQLSRQADKYYARDYLKVLRHPLVKNFSLSGNPTVTRVLVHKIEEILTGQLSGEFSGTLFFALDAVSTSVELFKLTQALLEGMGIAVTIDELKATLAEIHTSVFQFLEGVDDFERFAGGLEKFLKNFIDHSPLWRYPLNLKIAGKMLEIKDELATAAFCQEKFPQEDIFKIFTAKIERELIAFHGSPLKGLQILGLFETRSLNFDHVIVMDTNEGVLPHLSIYEPLIPREVMINLKLDRLEEEEEIQRYQFMRLISSAKTVHLVYEESRDKERSRFVEELVWDGQKKKNDLDVFRATRPAFRVKVTPRVTLVNKSPAMITFLKNFRYSASSVNTYLRNPMEFYTSYVLGLREREDLLEEPENREVGTFVHGLLEDTFKPFVGHKPTFDARFIERFFKLFEERFAQTFGRSMKSDAFLLKKVLEVRLRRFLEHEAATRSQTLKEILFIEKKFEDKIDLSAGQFNFVYRVDRVDKLNDGTVVIIDYKTGSIDPMPKAILRIEKLDLSLETIAENVRSFQIPLYFQYLHKYFRGQPVNAVFYNLRTLEFASFLDSKMTFDPERINQAFLRALDFVMAQIVNPDVPFVEMAAE